MVCRVVGAGGLAMSTLLRHLPNLISMLRILMVPPVAWLIVEQHYALALGLFVVAGVSDGVDGFLAKHYGWTSRLGSILDPLADKLLLSVSFVTLAWLGHLPLWLALLVLARDLVIIVGGVVYHHMVGRFSMRPTLLSKFNTFLQIVLVALVLLELAWLPLPGWLVEVPIVLLVLTVVGSGVDYIWTWGRRALRPPQNG